MHFHSTHLVGSPRQSRASLIHRASLNSFGSIQIDSVVALNKVQYVRLPDSGDVESALWMLWMPWITVRLVVKSNLYIMCCHVLPDCYKKRKKWKKCNCTILMFIYPSLRLVSLSETLASWHIIAPWLSLRRRYHPVRSESCASGAGWRLLGAQKGCSEQLVCGAKGGDSKRVSLMPLRQGAIQFAFDARFLDWNELNETKVCLTCVAHVRHMFGTWMHVKQC